MLLDALSFQRPLPTKTRTAGKRTISEVWKLGFFYGFLEFSGKSGADKHVSQVDTVLGQSLSSSESLDCATRRSCVVNQRSPSSCSASSGPAVLPIAAVVRQAAAPQELLK